MSWLRAGLTVGALILGAPPGHAQAPQIYTPTHGASCADRSRALFQAWRCPGPDGYVAEYFDEGNVAGVAVWRPGRNRQAERSLSWRGAGKAFGDLVEWRIREGQPFSAILRIWRVATDADGRERELEELMVLKLQPLGSCRVASIGTHQADANRRAQEIAAQAGSIVCRDAADTD